MEHQVNESMWDALVETLAILGKASEAAIGAEASDDAVMVTQRVHTVQGGLSLVDPSLAAAAAILEHEQIVTPSLQECWHWLVEAAGLLDEAVRSETTSLLPVGLLTVRADLAGVIRIVDALLVPAP